MLCWFLPYQCESIIIILYILMAHVKNAFSHLNITELGDMQVMNESLYVTTDLTKIQKDIAIYL